MTSSEADLNYENLIFNPLKSNSILLENISETDLISSNNNLNARIFYQRKHLNI